MEINNGELCNSPSGARSAILVLGMHRSGTSTVTRVLNFLGASLPESLMKPCSDNPGGYWESERITKFNNRLLESAGSNWKNDMPVSPEWFQHPDRKKDETAAENLLTEEFGRAELFVLKDPRLCVLLPFWLKVLEQMNISASAILVARDPEEVIRSLAARAGNPVFSPAAITDKNQCALLWMRYLLDSERFSRNLPRCVIDYHDFLKNSESVLARILGIASFPSQATEEEILEKIDNFLDPSLQHQRVEPQAEAESNSENKLGLLYRIKKTLCSGISESAGERMSSAFNKWNEDLTELQHTYHPLRTYPMNLASPDVRAGSILKLLSDTDSQGRYSHSGNVKKMKILILSGAPESVGHIFRVEHLLVALNKMGWNAAWLKMDDPQVESGLIHCGMVVVFRAKWDVNFDNVCSFCRINKIPLVYDTDDLIFDPECMADGSFAYLESLSSLERLKWTDDAGLYRRAILSADFATLTTSSLAREVKRMGIPVFVLPNTLNPSLEAAASQAILAPKPSQTDGKLRIGFASGTPTHQRDFEVVVPALAAILRKYPESILEIIGYLDISAFKALEEYNDRILFRPRVALDSLFAEIYRFDINLTPLEVGNRFCEAKSELRYIFASVVGVPSVVSTTEPMKNAVIPDVTGMYAANASEWYAALCRLMDDSVLRETIGNAANLKALSEFGWKRKLSITDSVCHTIVDCWENGMDKCPYNDPDLFSSAD